MDAVGMEFFGKKLMPVNNVIRRPPVHSTSCRLTILTGLMLTAAALPFVVIYAIENGTVRRDTISDNACSDGFTMQSNCRDVSQYPLIFDMQLHDYMGATMMLDRRPQSEEELHVALATMNCSVKRLGNEFMYSNEYGGVFENPDGLPYLCFSPDYPWVKMMLHGYSPVYTFERFATVVEIEAARLPPPNTSELKFQIVGAAVGKEVHGDDIVAFARVMFRMHNRENYWWGAYRYCSIGVTAAAVERDCLSGFPFYTTAELAADPYCMANYSADLAEYLKSAAHDIVGSPAFNVDFEVQTFDDLLDSTCNNFSRSLQYDLVTWEMIVARENARDVDTLITVAINDVLRRCPFQFTCTSEELTISNMLTVAFPLLTFLLEALRFGLPIVYSMWLKCTIRKSAAHLMDEHMGHIHSRGARAAQDEVFDEIRLLVDEEVRKAVAQIRDELFTTFRTDGAPDPEAQLSEAPFPPKSADNRETLANGGCAGGKPSAWQKELDALQKRVAAVESMLASVLAILAGFAGEDRFDDKAAVLTGLLSMDPEKTSGICPLHPTAEDGQSNAASGPLPVIPKSRPVELRIIPAGSQAGEEQEEQVHPGDEASQTSPRGRTPVTLELDLVKDWILEHTRVAVGEAGRRDVHNGRVTALLEGSTSHGETDAAADGAGPGQVLIQEFPGSLGGVDKPAAAPAMSMVDGTPPTALARAPRTAPPGAEAASSADDAATSGRVPQHAGSQEGYTSVSMFATGGCASASLKANDGYDPVVV